MSNTERMTWRERCAELTIAVLVPTYNNAGTVGQVIEGVAEYTDQIIVVNDGSTDGTKEILENYPEITLIQHPVNKGKGTALKNGLNKAREMGFRYVITIDSDGQHFPSDIPVFIEEIEKHPDALLVGARNLASENMPGKNTFANKFSNFWYRLETGINLEDTQSGYRLYPIAQMGSTKYYTSKYEFELEAIVFCAWKGIPVKNIPVHVYYPPAEERISHFRPVRDFTRISILNTFLVLACFFWIWPRDFFRKLTWENCKVFIRNNISNSPETNLRITLAIMLGIFMGIVPAWGYQMLLTLFLAHLLKLNKVIAIVAANISIPPMIPFLLYGSYLTGCKVLGTNVSLGLSELSLESIPTILFPYLVGSLIFAMLCSLLAGATAIGLLSAFRRTKSL